MEHDSRAQDFPKCARCSGIILDGELVLRDHDNWLHVRCARILRSADRVRTSRMLTRLSRSLIEAGRKRIERTDAFGERPAVLCVVCGQRIVSADELTIASSGPAHTHCRPRRQ